MRKQQLAIIALFLWLTLVSAFMLLTQQVGLEIFFVLCLCGLLVIVQLMQSHFVQPTYMRYMKYLIAGGVVLFGVIIILKLLDIMGWEIIIV